MRCILCGGRIECMGLEAFPISASITPVCGLCIQSVHSLADGFKGLIRKPMEFRESGTKVEVAR